MSDMHIDDDYKNLKRKVLESAASSDLDLCKIKAIFEDDFFPRRLSRIKTLKDLFRQLESIGVLHKYDVGALKQLGECINNERIKTLVKTYNLGLENEEHYCRCGENCTYSPKHPVPEDTSVFSHAGNLCMPQENENKDVQLVLQRHTDTELDAALENIALRIGAKWTVLARELDLYEMQIDKCRHDHPHDEVQQARQAFSYWRRSVPNASLQMLDAALGARLCRARGISAELKYPVIGFTC